MANGQNGGVGVSGRPQAGSGGSSAGPTPAAMPSPRLTPHAPPGPPGGLPPPHQPMWPGYYVRAVSLNLVTSLTLTY
jgi:translation initiation factor 4G